MTESTIIRKSIRRIKKKPKTKTKKKIKRVRTGRPKKNHRTRDRPARITNNIKKVDINLHLKAFEENKKRKPKYMKPRRYTGKVFNNKQTKSLSALNHPVNQEQMHINNLKELQKNEIEKKVQAVLGRYTGLSIPKAIKDAMKPDEVKRIDLAKPSIDFDTSTEKQLRAHFGLKSQIIQEVRKRILTLAERMRIPPQRSALKTVLVMMDKAGIVLTDETVKTVLGGFGDKRNEAVPPILVDYINRMARVEEEDEADEMLGEDEPEEEAEPASKPNTRSRSKTTTADEEEHETPPNQRRLLPPRDPLKSPPFAVPESYQIGSRKKWSVSEDGVLQYTGEDPLISLSGHGKRLKNPAIKPLYGSQIDTLMADYRKDGYLGWFCNDQIKDISKTDKLNKFDRLGFVVNTANSTDPQDGSVQEHWQGVYIDANEKEIDFYCSLAQEPSTEVFEALKAIMNKWIHGRKYYYKFKVNMVREQDARTNTCGFHVINWLMKRFDGVPFKKASKYVNLNEAEIKHFARKKGFGGRFGKKFGYFIPDTPTD